MGAYKKKKHGNKPKTSSKPKETLTQDSIKVISPEFPAKHVADDKAPAVDNSNHLNSAKSKTKIDISSKQDTNLGVTETQKRYIRDEGVDVYSEARSQGYGVKGAAMLLALSANESSYGDEANYQVALKRNNFFGDENTAGEKVIFPNREAGIEGGVDFFDKNKAFGNFRSDARQQDPDISTLGEDMKNYNPASDHGGHGDKYVSWLNDNMIPFVVQRTLETIPGRLTEIQNEKDADMKEIANLSMLPTMLDGKQKKKLGDDIATVKKLDAEKNKLIHIQHELTTGLPDKAPDWPIKKDIPAPAPDTVEPWHPPMALPDQQDTPTFPPFQSPIKMGSTDGSDAGQGYGSIGGSSGGGSGAGSGGGSGGGGSIQIGASTNTFNINPPAMLNQGAPSIASKIPGTADIAKPIAPSQNGMSKQKGGVGNISVNLNTSDNYHSHTHGTTGSVQDELVAILTSAISDSKIGGDVC